MSSVSAENGPHVILCKGESNSQEDEYVKSLSNLKVHGVSLLNLLQFTWKNIPRLADCLARADDYSGLILTSFRAVNAIKHCIDSQFGGSSDFLQAWSRKLVFCVGPKTISETRSQLGLQHSLDDDSAIGNVNSLVESISRQDIKLTAPLLFPSSSIVNADGPKLLEQLQIPFELVHVYDTLPACDAKTQFDSLIRALPDDLMLIIVFFSPSNFKAVAEPVDCLLKESQRQVKFIAFGPTTKAALETAGLRVESTLTKPTAECLCDVIKSYS